MNKCLNCCKPVKNKYCNTSCQNSHRNKKIHGNFKDFTVECNSCGKEVIVREREKLFPKKEKYFCNRSCANRRKHSINTKNKISKSVNFNQNKSYKITYNYCEGCGKLFITRDTAKNRNKKFCSRKCQYSNFGRIGGISSVKSQNRRSKNEKYFAELCKGEFNNVLTNEPIFNGWDADVIIEDLKIAVLWNGKWHYEKITEKHSLKQVENRDRIKIKEIKKKGYTPYVIKDMGKYDKDFVDNQFKIFLENFVN